jgi:hypothetical protein
VRDPGNRTIEAPGGTVEDRSESSLFIQTTPNKLMTKNILSPFAATQTMSSNLKVQKDIFENKSKTTEKHNRFLSLNESQNVEN